jgi:hypothetical protein
MLWQGGANFETPTADDHQGGLLQAVAADRRAKTLDSRTAFLLRATRSTPRHDHAGSARRLPVSDGLSGRRQERIDGAKTYKVTLPKGIPAAAFWSFTLYDNQTRSMLDTPQRYPRAGSQSYPSPAAESNPDGSTTVYFGPRQPAGVKRGNWIQTMPGKGWFTPSAPL